MRRRDFVGGVLAGGALLSAPARASTGGRCFVIVVANGGWDQTYCFDPKLSSAYVEGPEYRAPPWGPPDGPDDVNEIQTFGGIPIVVNPVKRPSVSRFFETWGDRTAVVNGIATGVISHYSSRLRMLTGTVLSTSPDLSVIAGRSLGYDMPLAQVDLASLSFTGPYAAGSGTLGVRSQIKALLQPEYPPLAPEGVPPYPRFLPDVEDEDAVRDFLRARADRFRTTRGATAASAAKLDDFDEALTRAERLRGQTAGLLGHLEVGIEADYSQMIDVAIELLANEVTQTVLFDTQAPWDTHSTNVVQNGCFEDTFAGLLVLAEGLATAGLLERTTVLVVSEMGRTPKHNVVYGKDHWPYASAMVFGAGVRHGVYGATDDELVARNVDLATGQPDDRAQPLRYDHFAAGMLELLGVDPAEHLPDSPPLRGFQA